MDIRKKENTSFFSNSAGEEGGERRNRGSRKIFLICSYSTSKGGGKGVGVVRKVKKKRKKREGNDYLQTSWGRGRSYAPVQERKGKRGSIYLYLLQGGEREKREEKVKSSPCPGGKTLLKKRRVCSLFHSLGKRGENPPSLKRRGKKRPPLPTFF